MNLLISFSGGETSAYMALWCLENLRDEYDEIRVVFANTGQENQETLRFVQRFSEHYGVDVTWIEAVVEHGKRVASGHKVVSYETASRNGEPFEEVIKKYGFPNQKFPHCTRELKLNPIKSYMQGIGWSDYYTAVGIRNDEIDRISPTAKQNGLIYPLISRKPMTKPMINQWWSEQPFRLNLKGYQGNCKWCWKKSLRKHMTLLNESPEVYDFPRQMEQKYPRHWRNDEWNDQTFFRNGMTVSDLESLAKKPFTPADDDAQVYPEADLFGFDLDISNGCSESCEINFDELGKA